MAEMQEITMAIIRKMFVEVIEQLTGYTRGRVLVETMADRRPVDGKPYCTLWFKNLEPLTYSEGDWQLDTDEPIQYQDNETLAMLQISFWGDDAFSEAYRLSQLFHAAARQFDLWRVVGYAGIDQVQDISTSYGAKIQQRAFFNLSFYVCLGRKIPADYFDKSQWGIELPAQNYEEHFVLPIQGV